MKTLRNTLFVDLTDSIIEKMMMRTTIKIEEKMGLKICVRASSKHCLTRTGNLGTMDMHELI
jgi:hypothetical protein